MQSQSLTGSAGAGDLTLALAITPDIELLDAAYDSELSPEQATFFKGQTGINNDDCLRTHILKVQEEAYKIFPYPCIRMLWFLRSDIATQPEYKRIIKIGQERSDGILLDVGCCFGADARKAVADGFPLNNVVTTDLKKEFFDMGHTLFNTTPETYPIKFIAGDAFDPDMLQIVPHFDDAPLTERPDLTTLTSLNPLAGRCAVIYASNFFHLFSEEKQLHLAKALAGLLSPQPGSIICGEHSGQLEKGVFHSGAAGWEFDMFKHCPESWKALWDGEVFPNGSVDVSVTVELVKRTSTYLRLQWSVVKL